MEAEIGKEIGGARFQRREKSPMNTIKDKTREAY